MFRRRNVTFSIQVQKEERWVVETVCDEEATAIARARTLLASKRFNGARVIREDSRFADKEIFREMMTEGSRLLTIGQVDSAPVCAELNDFHSYDAAKTLGRLLRAHLDDAVLTPWELIFNPSQIKRVTMNERLFGALIQRAASAQAVATGKPPLEHVTALFDAAEAMRRRASRLGDLPGYVGVLRAGGTAALLRKLEEEIAPSDRSYYVRAALALLLNEGMSWEGKLHILLEIGDKPSDETGWQVLDEGIALLIDPARAMTDILGQQRSLGDALIVLARAAAGTAAGAAGSTTMTRLSKLIARQELPQTRETLLERIRRGLSGAQPLAKPGESTERASLARIVEALVAGGALLGGGEMGEAIGRRAQLVFRSKGEDLPVQQALEAVLGMLPNRWMRANYLLGLSTTKLSTTHEAAILDCFADFLRRLTFESERGLSADHRQDISRTLEMIERELRSGHLSPEWGRMLAKETLQLISRTRAAA